MKHWNYISILLAVLSLSANAEVFKCKNATGKITYQPIPCSPGAATQGVIKVQEMTPEKAEEAKAKLETWKQQQAADDTAKQEAEKQRQAELEKQESLELQRRSVIAQEKQVIVEQQRQNPPVIVVPPYGRGGYLNNGGFQRDGSYYRNMMPNQPVQTDAYPPYKPYVAPPPPPFRSSSIPPRNNPPNMPGSGFDNRQYDGR
jgi:Domain of unknown function (DUF4124)